MDSNEDPNVVVTFSDTSGNVIGEAHSIEHGVWQLIPAAIAAKMVLNPQHVGMFRTSRQGDAELWAGPSSEVRAKLDEPPPAEPFGGIVDVAVDARVLHADGTWC
jgi:hypothetical protein